jgi:hypothetical protein
MHSHFVSGRCCCSSPSTAAAAAAAVSIPAAQELEQQQQSLLERHQHIISDLSPTNNTKARVPLDLGFGFGMRMQPTNAAGVLGGRAAAPAGHVVRAAANWLASHNVQQYHQGLVVSVLMSAGLWRDSMWEELDRGALR